MLDLYASREARRLRRREEAAARAHALDAIRARQEATDRDIALAKSRPGWEFVAPAEEEVLRQAEVTFQELAHASTYVEAIESRKAETSRADALAVELGEVVPELATLRAGNKKRTRNLLLATKRANATRKSRTDPVIQDLLMRRRRGEKWAVLHADAKERGVGVSTLMKKAKIAGLTKAPRKKGLARSR